MIVYHAHRQDDLGNYEKGYIGVTKDLDTRMVYHVKYDTAGNKHFQNALRKYSDIEWTTIFEGTEEECLIIEKELRPRREMGWNISVGGGKPPTQYWTDKPNPMAGKQFSEEHKRKISEGNLGKVRTEEHKVNYRKAVSERPDSHYDCHRGKNSSKWSGYIHTPEGVFETLLDAGKHHKINRQTVSNRIKNPKFKDWYRTKEER